MTGSSTRFSDVTSNCPPTDASGRALATWRAPTGRRPLTLGSGLFGLALAAVVGSAAAQVVVTPPAKKPGAVVVAPPARAPAAAVLRRAASVRAASGAVIARPVSDAAPALAWGTALAAMPGLRDSGNAAVAPALPPAYALSGFSLKFDNGDHKLRRIGVLGRGRFTHFALADSNGDDPFSASARYTTFAGPTAQGVVTGQVIAQGGGKFEIPLRGNPPPDATLVLSGFEFQREDGSDANLRSIGVWMDSDRKVARVSLMDDQGVDFRGFENTVGAAFANGVLPGVFEGVLAANVPAAVRQIRGAGAYRPYRVTVQYAWVPKAWVDQEGAISGTDRQRRQRPPSRIDALQGFEVMFTNGDHHVLGLGVNPGGAGGVLFQDNNTDDPLQWTAAYLTLNPAAP